MAKNKWDEEKIIKNIHRLVDLEEDLTWSNVKQVDSALVGAAVSYFGSWRAAIEEAGLDYKEIRKISQDSRRQKVRKWSEQKILEDIKKISRDEDDLSYAFMKEKHSSLVAAAINYFGSWKNAIESLGLDYAKVIRTGRKKRIEREKAWRRSLLLERLDGMKCLEEKKINEKAPEFYDMLIDYFQSWRRVVSALKKWREEGKGNQ